MHLAQPPAATKRKTADARGCTQMNMIVQGFYPWTQNDRGILSLGLDYQTNESKGKMDQSVFKFPNNFAKKTRSC